MPLQKLLVRPQPEPGESLFSVLLRLAKANSYPILTLLTDVADTGSHFLQRRDLPLVDISPGSLLDLVKLSGLTEFASEQITRTTFYAAMSTFSQTGNLERARFMSAMLENNLRYCPQCIGESPYLRLMWRLKGTVGCLRHGAVLSRECSSCGKRIKYQDIILCSKCPHCQSSLATGHHHNDLDSDTRNQQIWWYNAWTTLLSQDYPNYTHDDIAMRLLYVFNDHERDFNIARTRERLPEQHQLQTLLQHARKTLHQPRAVHLTLLFNFLYKFGIPLGQFLELAVPQEFSDSVMQRYEPRIQRLACQAPWCSSYQSPGTLVKSGTAVKQRKSGDRLVYFCACTECACEYAINGDGSLVERTYFIKFYRRYQSIGLQTLSSREIAHFTGFTVDRVNRCLAYFASRPTAEIPSGRPDLINDDLVAMFIEAIQNAQALKCISKLSCWQSQFHFLMHRFHPHVMRALLNLERPRPSSRSPKVDKEAIVLNAIFTLKRDNRTINVREICSILDVCPETLRNWGCLELVKSAKHTQTFERRMDFLSSIPDKADQFLSGKEGQPVSSNELYSCLGIQRTVLWRIAPDATKDLTSKLKAHSRHVQKTVSFST